MVRTKKDIDSEVEGDVGDEKEIRLGIYEVGYLMVPTIAEENLGGEVTSFKDMFWDYGRVLIKYSGYICPNLRIMIPAIALA